MSARWQISAGELFELLRPAAFLLSVLFSSWVLASARRNDFRFPAAALWTLGTLLYPPVFLPIYLIVRHSRRRRRGPKDTNVSGDEGEASAAGLATGGDAQASETAHDSELKNVTPPRRGRFLIPFTYAATALALGAFFYYRDVRSVDAHLARANEARVAGRREKMISEYRAALKLEDDAHTHNLLARELAAAARWEEALAEFRAAESGGEPDDEIPFRKGAALDALDRHVEAEAAYRQFLSSSTCGQSPPDPRCEAARARLRASVAERSDTSPTEKR